MNSLWHSGIQNTQYIVRATGWYCGSMLSRDTMTPIEAKTEEESAKRCSDVKRWSTNLNNRKNGCRQRYSLS
jgi:hypothetical protein